MSYTPRIPVAEDEVLEVTQDCMDVVYHGPRSKESHLKHFISSTSMCGQWPKNWSWLGLEDQNQRDRARALPICRGCIGAAFMGGYLRKRDT